jgi:hypothetical protein
VTRIFWYFFREERALESIVKRVVVHQHMEWAQSPSKNKANRTQWLAAPTLNLSSLFLILLNSVTKRFEVTIIVTSRLVIAIHFTARPEHANKICSSAQDSHSDHELVVIRYKLESSQAQRSIITID